MLDHGPDNRSFNEWRDDLAALFEEQARTIEDRPDMARRAAVLRMLAVVLRIQVK